MGTSNQAKNQDDDSKSLWSYVTKVKRAKGSGHEIRCNLCGLSFVGSYTKVRAHLLKISKKGIRVCEKVTPSRLLEFRKIENEIVASRVHKSKSMAKSISSKYNKNQEKNRKRSRETLHWEIVEDDEIHPNIAQCEGDGIKLEEEMLLFEELQSEDSSSSVTGSDSDDPFNQVDKKLSVGSKEAAISFLACSGDESLASIIDAIGSLEVLLIKDLSEVTFDPELQSQLDNFLELLISSSHPKVKVELDALVKFKRKVFASFQKFQASFESVNKLKNFEKQKARIQKQTLAGKNIRKNLKNSIKKTSLTIKDEKSRKKELEAEIATLREQLAIKEMDLEQLKLNVKFLEAEVETNEKDCDSLEVQARALSKDADELLAANIGVEDEGKAAEVKQHVLNLTWSTDLRSRLSKIKKNILGLSSTM